MFRVLISMRVPGFLKYTHPDQPTLRSRADELYGLYAKSVLHGFRCRAVQRSGFARS